MYPKEHKRRVVTSSIVNYSIEYFGWCVCEALAVWRENVSPPPPPPTCAGRFGPFLDFVTPVITKIKRGLGKFPKILESLGATNTKGIR